MTFEQILLIINGILFAVSGYFLKQTMDKLKSIEEKGIENTTQIELVRQENILKHEFNTKEFKDLRDSVKELNSTIKELNNRLTKE